MKRIILLLLCLAVLTSKTSYSQEYKCNNEGKNPTSVKVSDVISCSFEQEQDADIFLLSSTNASRINIRVSPPSGNCTGVTDFTPLIKVYNSSNEQIAARGTSGACNIGTESFTTIENETYSVVISDNNQQTPIAYTIELQCLSGSCISSSLVQAEEYTSKFDGQQLRIPYVDVDGSNFWANLKLISSSPVQFELTDLGSSD
ncbi:MAG: hypothetical protein V3U87_02810 [Methylococcaceae bacterium]